ncbi:flagellar assembly protein FlgT [Aliivibrio sp. S4TY2]|uniref:flagellar assembly protein FlgT n=1 Tax=unclassified Aliivibrio TaxID=2645654 RepID=UPI0023783588|nr:MULTISPECIES: flagellar assembly protein FlgT [unclassified Aliivibrio]MDD9154812.1 flagellar assembly protein FlgT [Aliivibrio sp. S4TY2]MDD9158825.1 flagellar assembly protein FlgT [Aliivibrio sp. S4TY1]MDD9162815.1 flagellar assembly protein FlgT [Aliivibrio sp. S4MY2]MDD9166824.1 flagellar assembly protein FlgT [Aliivibrio sp. S4MY4]MDD9183892.1 flagellar assembly protein FlgT [Aliivibrio sp. S4MY3]
MKKTLLLLTSILTMSYALPSKAEWFEVTGSASVLTSKSAARSHALEDAAYQAMLFSGADISRLKDLKTFLENDEKHYQFSGSEIRSIEVIKEKKKNGKIYITTRIDIYPSANSCHIGQYKKTFMTSEITIDSPQQAVMGKVYQLGEDLSTVFSRQLDKESQSFVSVGNSHIRIDKRQPDVVKMIADDHGAQYIFSGNITDLSATVEQNLLKNDTINRQFAIEVAVLDGKTGQTIYNNNYREVAQWDFPKTSEVDTQSARFWTSAFGEMVLRVNRDMMLDLENQFACKMTLPQIVSINNNRISMDLGRIHGVKKGDKLELWHTGSFIDQNGLPRNKVSKTEITLTVARVYEQNAELTIDQPQLLNSIQIGDVMHKVDIQ